MFKCSIKVGNTFKNIITCSPSRDATAASEGYFRIHFAHYMILHGIASNEKRLYKLQGKRADLYKQRERHAAEEVRTPRKIQVICICSNTLCIYNKTVVIY